MIQIELPTKEESNKATAEAEIRRAEANRLINYNLPMLIFLKDMVGRLTQIYGPHIELKIVYDSVGHLKKAPKNYGDRYAYSPLHKRKIYFEIKTSFSSDENTYRITHTRSYELFDYFLICLVDQDDQFTPRFYLLPKEFITNNPKFKLGAMNGNADTNELNVNIEMSKTISKDFAHSYFGHHNVLKGTDYSHWIDFLNTILFVPQKQNMMVNMMTNPIVPTGKKYIFKVNDINIEGKDNNDTILKLANYIGGLTAYNIFPKDKISRIPSKNCEVKLNVGDYFINPHFNISEIRSTIFNSIRHSKTKIEII